MSSSLSASCGYEFLEAIGEQGRRSTIAGHLADALYRLDRKADAEHLADLSLELTSRDDIATQARGRAVKAKLLAAKGEYDAAYHLAREAVGLSEDTDDLVMHGEVLMAQAEVLRLGGRDADAIPVLRQAVEVSERKGNVVTGQEAPARLAGLHAGTSAPPPEDRDIPGGDRRDTPGDLRAGRRAGHLDGGRRRRSCRRAAETGLTRRAGLPWPGVSRPPHPGAVA